MSQNIEQIPTNIRGLAQQESAPSNLPQELWGRVCLDLRSQMNGEILDLWLRPVKPLLYQNHILCIEVPNRPIAAWIQENSQKNIESSLKSILGEETALEIRIAPELESSTAVSPEVLPPQSQKPILSASAPETTDSKYTFETFVEGQSNRFAKAAAEGVSKEPGIRFNPLFLYGGVGLGKTHLMHAIVNSLQKSHPDSRVLYSTSEKFINEFIESLRNNRPAEFRNKYRNLDCLLIDDIQFLTSKERSEEEFFHTFNILFDSRKQIVISSDRPPKELGTLQDRLISRFEWGVVADIQPPDLETRIAILRKKAEQDGLLVPEDVTLFIAGQVKTNIRRLEGSLIRIVSRSLLNNIPLTVDMARETLKDVVSLENSERPITLDLIYEVTARNFNLDPKEMKSKRRTDAIAWPRQIAMYLARILTEASTTEIGEYFGGKDHTTVLHACEKVKMKIADSPFIASLVNKITQEIRNQNHTGG